MPVPGPMGSQPAPGNPPTPASPGAGDVNPQTTNTNPTSSYQSTLQSLLQSQINPILAGTAQQQAGIGYQQAGAYGQEGTTDTLAAQTLQDTLQSLGIQGLGLGQEQQYEQGQYGITQAGYGLQQQQLNLSGKEAVQGEAGSGTLGTGTARQQQQQQGIQQSQLGLEEKGSALSNTYQQQQLQNALKQLGLQKTEAGQSATNTTQSAANQYTQQLGSLIGQQGQLGVGESSGIANILDELYQSVGY